VNKIFILKLNNKYYNAQMNRKHIRKHCALDDASKELLKTAIERLNLSARAYDRILKVPRIIAYLAAAPNVISGILPKRFSIVALIVMAG
jgi:magnesium chelatase family protein